MRIILAFHVVVKFACVLIFDVFYMLCYVYFLIYFDVASV